MRPLVKDKLNYILLNPRVVTVQDAAGHAVASHAVAVRRSVILLWLSNINGK